jgi:molybdopterin molybdotransferase
MISVDDAFSILNKITFSLKEEDVSLRDAHSFILAETLISPISMPPFRQANMDGFALSLHDQLTYDIVGEIKAGDYFDGQLQPGQAMKIFTGAAVPDSTQAVIQIEKVIVNNHQLQLQENVKPETNVRPLGSQIEKGTMALEKGSILNPAAIGFLAGLGFTSVKVYAKPKVGIVITGNELVQAGQPLPNGKVYESNAIMLQLALQSEHYDQINSYQVEDTFEATKSALQQAIEENDVILVSGGISVGDYDFVGKALQSLAVETLFYKVNQKPGKPLYCGKLKDKMIFALPGNPAASLTCLYVYVLPTLHRISGKNASYMPSITKPLVHDFEVNNSRSQFLKALVIGDEVTILPHQDSSMLDSFATANAVVFVQDGCYELAIGASVGVYQL